MPHNQPKYKQKIAQEIWNVFNDPRGEITEEEILRAFRALPKESHA